MTNIGIWDDDKLHIMKKNYSFLLIIIAMGLTQAKSQDSTKLKEETPEFSFRTNLSYGLSYITDAIPEHTPEWMIPYLNELRTGYCISGDLNIYTRKTSGVTLKGSMMRTKNEMDGVVVVNQNGQQETGIMRDDMAVYFIGAGLFGRGNVGNSKSCFIDAQIALGYLSYSNNGMYVHSYNIGGNSFAGYCGLGFDYLIGKGFALGVDISSPIATIREIGITGAVNKVVKLDLENSITISRLNFSFGIKGYF